MATTEFSTGKTVFVLAIVIGCFALLWPRIFSPMVQNTVPTPTRPQNDLYAQNRPSSGCCDVVYDYDIDNNFFARLCEILVQREEGATVKPISPQQIKTDLKIKIEVKKPGVRQMCREKVLEMCQVDVGNVLNQDPKSSEYQEAMEQIRSQNVSYCLRRHYEKHEKFTLLAQKMRHRRFMKKSVRSASPGVHPAMREKGVPIATRIRESHSHKSKVETVMPPRLAAGAYPKPTPQAAMKGTTTTSSMGLIMPMYTIGIVVFFIYTVMKVMFRSRGEDTQSTITAFHTDPDYRRYVLGQDYVGPAEILSYHDYLRKKDKEEKLKYNILEDDDRKLMFTAIQGIVAEMDDYREQIIKKETEKDENEIEIEKETETDVPNNVTQQIPTISTTMDEEETKQASVAPVEILRDSLQAQMSLDESDLLPTIHEDAKFAVLGVETTAVFDAPRSPTPGRSASPNPFARAPSPSPSPVARAPSPGPSPPPSPLTPTPQDGDRESNVTTPTPEMSSPQPRLAEFVVPDNVPNIILDTNFPSESQLVVSESQETISQDGEEMADGDDEQTGVVIAGKMTISLIDMEANHVESTSGEENEDEMNRQISLLDSELYTTPASASEETMMEEITTVEEILTETTTTTIVDPKNQPQLNLDNKMEDEEEDDEEDEETETSDDESDENPTPPVPKDPLRNVQ